MAVISLLTDFGLQDEFVGVMHGVIYGRSPTARIVDMCHAIPPGDGRRAAYLLDWACRYFPPNTVHVVVVDPGVGTDRRILCARAHRQFFLAPDNGVLTWVLQRAARPIVYEVRPSRHWLHPVSHTFHGRDIFAPVAAQLSQGASPRTLGPRTTTWVTLSRPPVRRQGRACHGVVIDIDRFGNVMTNLDATVWGRAPAPPPPLRCVLKGRCIGGVVRTYRDVRRGEPAAILGSRGFLEIAVRDGSAAATFHAKIGDPVIVEPV